MGSISTKRIVQWLFLLMVLVAATWIWTEPDERFAAAVPSGRVDLWIGANGDLVLNHEPIQHEAWIHRLRLASIQVPQPPIRIQAAPDTSYGFVHEAYHDAWEMRLPHIGYVIGSGPEVTIPLTEPTKREILNRNLREQVLLHIDAQGAMSWNGTAIHERGLYAQVAVLTASGRPVRVTIQANDRAAWRVLAGALLVISRCSVCNAGAFEESETAVRRWIPLPPPIPKKLWVIGN